MVSGFMCGCVGEYWVVCVACLRQGRFYTSVVICSSFLVVGSSFFWTCVNQNFRRHVGFPLQHRFFLTFSTLLKRSPRLLLLGPENFSLHFKVYVALESYGLLFQKFVSLGNAQKRKAV